MEIRTGARHWKNKGPGRPGSALAQWELWSQVWGRNSSCDPVVGMGGEEGAARGQQAREMWPTSARCVHIFSPCHVINPLFSYFCGLLFKIQQSHCSFNLCFLLLP